MTSDRTILSLASREDHLPTQQPLPCALCGHGALEPFLQIAAVPVHVGVLWPDAASARSCAKGDLRLALCRQCGFVSNIAFDPDLIDYTQKYDNALHASPVFREFEQSLADHLIGRYGLRGRTVAEIGCGNGHFLGLLCKLGDNRGIGFDPSYDPEHTDPLAVGRVHFVRDHYSDRYADVAADLLVCRQMLEHVADPGALLRTVRGALADNPDTVVYFEVPNSTMPFRDLSIWDLIYEHCTYFVAASLRHVFEANGFAVTALRQTYADQFLSLEARVTDAAPPDPPGAESLERLVRDLDQFAGRFRERRDTWSTRLREFAAQGRKAVVWGGGARAVSFFNMLGIGDEIEYVVDLNVRKQGTHIGGAGQRIVAPEFLTGYRPDVVIILNPLYRTEITDALAGLGVKADVLQA